MEKTLTRRRLVRRTMTETAKDEKTSSRALLVRREVIRLKRIYNF
jgi:hypothetical protein